MRQTYQNPRITTVALIIYKIRQADPSGRAVLGVGLQPLACWNCGFQSRRGHGFLSLVRDVCCQVEVSATG